jgi:nucleoside-diphosphate-sugar epimerase
MNDRLRREGTEILLRVAQEGQADSYIQQSIAFVYGDVQERWLTEEVEPKPDRVTQSALDGEKLCLNAYRTNNVPVVILRGAMFYSAEASSTRMLLDSIKARRAPILGSGKQYCHYIHVEDMARAVLTATLSPAPGEIFLVADDWPVHARELLDFLAEKLHAPSPMQMPVWFTGILGKGSMTFLKNSARYNTDKIKKMLGWSPRYSTFHDGFAQVFSQLGIPF